LPFSQAVNYQYDTNGNTIQDASFHYEYDALNQLVKAFNLSGTLIEQYTYDENGKRLTKYEPLINQTTYYINENYILITNSSGSFDSVYYYANDQLVAVEDYRNNTQYYHPDHLGSTTLITNQTGDILEEDSYLPFGEPEQASSSLLMYTGKEQDKGTGLLYYGARYYKPPWFIQPDANIPNPYNPQDLNRYSYVRNNPYKYVDPNGEFACDANAGCSAVFFGPFVFMSGNIAYDDDDEISYFMGQQIVKSSHAEIKNQGFNELMFALGMMATGGIETSGARGNLKNLGKSADDAINSASKMENLIPKSTWPEGSGISKTLSTSRGDITLNEHTLKQMQARNLGRTDVLNTIEKGESFKYYHEGVWKTGYYDPKSRVFVGTYKGEAKTTFKTDQNYINNLKKNKPPRRNS